MSSSLLCIRAWCQKLNKTTIVKVKTRTKGKGKKNDALKIIRH